MDYCNRVYRIKCCGMTEVTKLSLGGIHKGSEGSNVSAAISRMSRN